MKGRFRLRRHSDFQTVIGGKRIYSGRAIVAFAVPSQAKESRVGVTVSRALKGSVERNRARRRLRELARIKLLAPDSPLLAVGIPYDVVMIARPAALEVSFADLRAEADQALLKITGLIPGTRP